jgi:hypothetical protein
MARGVILYDDRVAAATLSGAATVSGLPVSNMQDPQPRKVARWSGTTGYVVADFGASVPVGMVAVAGTNLSTGATRRVRLSSADATGAAGDVHDSGTAAAGADPRYNGSFGYVLSSDLSARYLRVDFTDATLSFIDAGLLLAGPCLRPGKNFAFGWSLGYRDMGQADVSPIGTLFASRRGRGRVVDLRFPYATAAEAMTGFLEMKRIAGITENVAVWPENDGTYKTQQLVIGLVADALPIRNDAFNVWSDQATVVERI